MSSLPILPIHCSRAASEAPAIPDIMPDTEIKSIYTSGIVCRGPLPEGTICDAPEDSCYYGLPYRVLLYSISNGTFLAASHLECIYIDLSTPDSVILPVNIGLRFETRSFPYPPGSSHKFTLVATLASQYRITRLREGRDCPFFNGCVGDGGSSKTVHTLTFKTPGCYTLDVTVYGDGNRRHKKIINVTEATSVVSTPSHWLVDGKY